MSEAAAEVMGDVVDTGAAEVDAPETTETSDVDMSARPPRDPQVDGGDDSNPESGALHTVKVDGEEMQLTLDELKAGYSRGAAATRRFQEAANQRKEVQQFVSQLKAGDRHTIASLFDRIGVDFTKLAEEHLSEYLTDLDAPEHVRGMRELERKRAAFEKQQKEAETSQREAQIEREAAQLQQQMRTEMTSALTKHNLPASPTIIAKVAKEMEMALTHDYPMSVEDAVQMVAEETRLLLRKLPPDAAARLMGGQAAVEQAQRAEAAKAAAAQKAKAAQTSRSPKQRAPERRIVDPTDLDSLKAFFDS